MNGLLERIVTRKRAEIERLRARTVASVERDVVDVVAALRKPDSLALIAEGKFRSPSAGDLSRSLDAGARARAYANAGAAMVSILCDEPFFGGSYDDVTR